VGRVEGKVALITGAAARPGIGSSTAELLAAEGATVYVSDIDTPGVSSVAKAINGSGGNATALTHDVGIEPDWIRGISTIVEKAGRLDILVNNAGIIVLQKIEEMTSDLWDRQITVNLTSYAIAEIHKRGSGSIINISSVLGLIGVPACSAYSASKGGVRLFTKCAALETAREGIRVNSVHPGRIETNIVAAVRKTPEQRAAAADAIPMGHLGLPKDVAHCVLFLASDESCYVTGAEYLVDGGLTAA